MGSTFGRVCLEAFDRNPADFGRTVMSLLERDYGVTSLQEALRAAVAGRAALATAVNWILGLLRSKSLNQEIVDIQVITQVFP